MKKFFISACLFLSILAGYGQWTWQNPLPQGNDLSSVFFVNNQVGYNVGDCGIIVKTTDGGTTWSILNSRTTSRLSSVCFTDANTGYAVGDYGTILKTNNAGASWTRLSSGTNNILFSVYFNDANTGYVAGYNGTILKTTNGGVTFIDDSSFPEKSFSVYPNPATTAITVSIPGIFSKCQLSIMNANNQELITRQITEPATAIDISHLAAGIYLVRITNDQFVKVAKVIKL